MALLWVILRKERAKIHFDAYMKCVRKNKDVGMGVMNDFITPTKMRCVYSVCHVHDFLHKHTHSQNNALSTCKEHAENGVVQCLEPHSLP